VVCVDCVFGWFSLLRGWWLVTKGKPWTVDEELKLKELFEAGEPISKIAAELSKTENAVGHKLWRLGLKEGTRQKSFVPSSSTEVELPEGVPTIEEALRTLAWVMVRLRDEDLGSGEMRRLRLLADVVGKYKGVYADYIDRRRLEMKYEALEKRYEELKKKYEGWERDHR